MNEGEKPTTKIHHNHRTGGLPTEIRQSIINVARMGRFFSDLSIRDYCDGIWGTGPVPV